MRRYLWFFFLCCGIAWAEPHANIGPIGEWVANDRWHMKVEKVTTVDDMSAFLKLPWTKGIASPKGQKYVDQVDRLVFSKKHRVCLIDVSLKNIGTGSQKIGRHMPPWYIRCDDGQEVRNTGAVSDGAIAFIGDPLPKLGPVKAGATLRGRMVFVLPKAREARLFFFKAPAASVEKFAGKSETLVARLTDKKLTKVAPLKVAHPDAPWQSNGKWKMRLTDSRTVKSLAAYKALPWGPRLTGEAKTKHFSYVERNVFNKGQTVLLVTVEAKNLTGKKAKIGYEIPSWEVKCANDKSFRLAGVYQQTIGWALSGGMPKNTLLNPNAIAGGTFGFFVPKNHKPQTLDFQVIRTLQKTYGESGSISFKL